MDLQLDFDASLFHAATAPDYLGLEFIELLPAQRKRRPSASACRSLGSHQEGRPAFETGGAVAQRRRTSDCELPTAQLGRPFSPAPRSLAGAMAFRASAAARRLLSAPAPMASATQGDAGPMK